MIWKNILAAALLVASFSFVQTASAQEPGNFPFPAEEQAEDPSPVNPAQKSLESGKVMIVVGSQRHFGYRIGEVIPVTVVIAADDGIKVNIETLKRNVLAADGSDFEISEPPIFIEEVRDGKAVTRIHLRLRSWVVKPTLVLNAEFFYAIDLLPDGVTPRWKLARTPDFVVTTSNTASETSKELLEGDMDPKVTPEPWVSQPLRYAGFALMSLLPFWLLYQVWTRTRPVRYRSPAEKAWIVFERVFAEGNQLGTMNKDHYAGLAKALRIYLGVESVATERAGTHLNSFFDGRLDQDEMTATALSALSKLDRALYSTVALTTAEQQLLVTELERLVPHP